MSEICESLAYVDQAVSCSRCERKVHYFDKLNDGRLVCLSCSYEERFAVGDDTVYHGVEFDIRNPDLCAEMVRIAKIDIDRADKVVCTVDIVLPEDLWDPLSKLAARDGAPVNAEIVSALGWYVSARMSNSQQVVTSQESIKAESSELAKILGADDSGVHSP